jgi:hypothetical protein
MSNVKDQISNEIQIPNGVTQGFSLDTFDGAKPRFLNRG